MNKDFNIFDFSNNFVEVISLQTTIGFFEVATIISIEGILIAAILEIKTRIVWIVCEKLNLFKHEKDESITIETE